MLIVEDNASMRAALVEHLQGAFPALSIVECGDGASALSACRRRSFRIAVLDIGLPDVQGLELIVPIRSLRPECQVIVVSQHTVDAYRERARKLGSFAYIPKEAIFRDLPPAIERALRSGRTR